MIKQRKLAIIGCGPRGLNALENLISNLSKEDKLNLLHLFLFEETGNWGNGQVYTLDQVDTNWINISERILYLDKREEINVGELSIPVFPSYHDWADIAIGKLVKNEPDFYPPRSKIGKYLHQRFESIINPLLKAEIVSLHEESVKNVIYLSNAKFKIITELNTFNSIDEVLLTIGHQPTEISRQMASWKRVFKVNSEVSLIEDPYPIENILNCKNLSDKSTIAIRGFGLAMIDIVRGIATKFGKFRITSKTTHKCEYESSSELSNLIIPFSLDGLPPSPKPLNATIDKLYQPSDKQLSDFKINIGDPIAQRNAKSSDFLINAIAPIITNVYSQLPNSYFKNNISLEEIEQAVITWLKDDQFENRLIVPQKQSAQKTMQEFVEMATSKAVISLDFCIGQVWRHCQPTIYKQLSFNNCKDEVFAQIIELDERLKRYSYGPPVESIQQMLALCSAGVMNLDFVNNPDTDLSKKGWSFKSNGKHIICDIMLNSVLDAPQIKSVDSAIVKNLLSNDLISVVHDDYGVLTTENGYLIPNGSNEPIPLALLGRLAKGSIIGVDAISECFGNRPENWAATAAKRHIEWLSKNNK